MRLAEDAAGIRSSLLLPWTLAAGAVLLALLGWLRAPSPTSPVGTGVDIEAAELKRLRSALTSARSEVLTLHRELDRLIASGAALGAATRCPDLAATSSVPSSKWQAPSEAERAELVRRLQESLAAAAAGDASARE